ncbi:hypothetical protein [Cytobacillus oceanisediminis]|jgi:hypothetical protein|nr:hypothetical protein [Cytobacillus oceanisediminis]
MLYQVKELQYNAKTGIRIGFMLTDWRQGDIPVPAEVSLFAPAPK